MKYINRPSLPELVNLHRRILLLTSNKLIHFNQLVLRKNQHFILRIVFKIVNKQKHVVVTVKRWYSMTDGDIGTFHRQTKPVYVPRVSQV